MNIKKNAKGVTLSLLVVTILVMLIIFSITVSTSMELIKNSRRSKMKTMLFMVEARAELLLEEYLFENDGKDLNNVSDAEIESYLGGKYIKNANELLIEDFISDGIQSKDNIIYCSWNEDTLQSQGIDTKNLANGDTIIIKYKLQENEVEVASKKGSLENDGTVIHNLKDF